MDKLFLVGKMADCTPEEVLVYCYLRSDIVNSNTSSVKEYKHKGLLVSGSSVQAIAQALGLPEVAVKQSIDGLCRKEWIKQLKESGTVYQLGSITDFESKWMVEASSLSKKHAGVKSSILKMTRERKEREKINGRTVKMSAELKQGIARGITKGEFTSEKPSQVLKQKFCIGYKMVTRSGYKSDPAKDNMFMLKFYGFCDNDIDAAKDLMSFVFDNWKAMQATMGLLGVPTTGIFATIKIVKQFKTYKQFGVPTKAIEGTGVGKRFDKTLSEEDADEGF